MPGDGVVRGHRGAGGAGRRVAAVRAGPVGRAARAAGRRDVARGGGAGGAPVAVEQLHYPRGQLRRQGARRQGPRHPLRYYWLALDLLIPTYALRTNARARTAPLGSGGPEFDETTHKMPNSAVALPRSVAYVRVDGDACTWPLQIELIKMWRIKK